MQFATPLFYLSLAELLDLGALMLTSFFPFIFLYAETAFFWDDGDEKKSQIAKSYRGDNPFIYFLNYTKVTGN